MKFSKHGLFAGALFLLFLSNGAKAEDHSAMMNGNMAGMMARMHGNMNGMMAERMKAMKGKSGESPGGCPMSGHTMGQHDHQDKTQPQIK